MNSKSSVLFVCMGNICRSPAADGLFVDYVTEKGMLGSIRIDSGGTHSYHIGDRADSRMRKAAAARGHDLTSRARQVTVRDLQEFDMVIAMDRDNFEIIDALDDDCDSQRHATVCLFSDFLGDEWPTDVPDPYYGGDDGFEMVLDMIEAGCKPLLERLQKEFLV